MAVSIGIIGAGFSGTALAATLHRRAKQPLNIILLDKSGEFGAGFAYCTPFSYHLLNVRAKDMSAFEDQPHHFVDWLKSNTTNLNKMLPIEEQFVARLLYGKYLKSLLRSIQDDASSMVNVKTIAANVIDIIIEKNQAKLILDNGEPIYVDKAVLAIGNGSPSQFPFPVSAATSSLNNPWNYTALNEIPQQDPVMIVGTGLSMIDAILTLYHQQHQGPIYTLSRHGLLPLRHSDRDEIFTMDLKQLSKPPRLMLQYLRHQARQYMQSGGDWRSIVNGLRQHLPTLWQQATIKEKKLFFRHLLPYWNIHRHRVHPPLSDMLNQLASIGQLKVIAGRLIRVEQHKAYVSCRHTGDVSSMDVKWLINCMGPSLNMKASHEPLVSCLVNSNEASLDELNLGFRVTPQGALLREIGESPFLYSLGPPTKGSIWECMAVPGIRKQISLLTNELLAK